MNCKLLSSFLLITASFLFSCKEKRQETNETKVHYFSSADTTFLFPEKYRRKNYRDYEFERNSRWLNNFGEQKLFDSSDYTDYIRLVYGRTFGNGIIVLIDPGKVVVKEEDRSRNDYNHQLDSSLLTVEEKKWLTTSSYYQWLNKFHPEDSAKIIASILKEFPDIEDNEKRIYLNFFKAEVFSADSFIYTEILKPLDKAFIKDFFQKIDSLNFWSYKNTYFEYVTDGSGFCLEIRMGNKYQCVYCGNCLVKELIYLRDEILKFTNLKKDEIY